MDASEIVAQSVEQERARIRFLERSRGVDAARAFARQTCSLYRRAVVQRSAPAGETVFRLRFIGSYCYLKQYLASPSPELEPGARNPDQ